MSSINPFDTTPPAPSFIDELQPASFRGVPFGVITADGRFGRRMAEHEYPFRDKPWLEDLGRATRKISFVGFLISDSLVYGGGDVIDQRERMIAACETNGPGTLIHPTLGELLVSCPQDGLTVIERGNEWRYFELGFSFIESGAREFPSADSATEDDADEAADESDLQTAMDYILAVQIAIARGEAVLKQLLRVTNGFIGSVLRLANDATGLFTMVVDLPGEFGRYFPGGTGGFGGRSLPIAGLPLTVGGLIAQGAAARSAVVAATATLLAAVNGSDTAAQASAAQALVAALLAATPDPGVALRLLEALAAFFPDDPTTDSVIGQAMAAVQAAFGALARRAALAALVRAAASYQPTSRDDAAAVRDQITALLDAEILVAGDAGDDNSYMALRALRTACVVDLNSRGAALPAMKVFAFNGNLPALVLAQTLYQDATRGDELVIEANPPHPAFMPLSFSALES